MMARDFGFIRADKRTGRWHWPFSEMEDGDFFKVDPFDRSRNRVANLVTCRAYQLGRKFSVRTGPDRVVTVYCGEAAVVPKGRAIAVKYTDFRDNILWETGFDTEKVPWEMLPEIVEKWPMFLPGKIAKAKGNRRVIFVLNNIVFGIVLQDEGLRVSLLTEGTTPAQWDAILDAEESLGSQPSLATPLRGMSPNGLAAYRLKQARHLLDD